MWPGDLVGQAADMAGGDVDPGAKPEELGIDAPVLDNLELDINELLAKFTRHA